MPRLPIRAAKPTHCVALSGVLLTTIIASAQTSRPSAERLLQPYPAPNAFSEIGAKLDAAARVFEEFGSVSLSSPYLIPAPTKDSKDNPFAFVLKKQGADDVNSDWFLARAREDTNGAVSTTDMSQFALQLAAQGQQSVPLTQAFNSSQAAYEADLASFNRRQELARQEVDLQHKVDLAAIPADSTPEQRALKETEAELKRVKALKELEQATRPTYPAAGTFNTTPPALPSARREAIPNDFSGRGALLAKPAGAPALNVPLRGALIAGAGHQATYGLLSVLGDPARFVEFKDKKVLLGVAMVNVDPGWRTRRDFIGEVAVTVSYDYKPARPEVLEAAMRADPTTNPQAKVVQDLIKAWNPEWADAVLPTLAQLTQRKKRLVTDVATMKENFANVSKLIAEARSAPDITLDLPEYGEACLFAHLAKLEEELTNLRDLSGIPLAKVQDAYDKYLESPQPANLRELDRAVQSATEAVALRNWKLARLVGVLKTITEKVATATDAKARSAAAADFAAAEEISRRCTVLHGNTSVLAATLVITMQAESTPNASRPSVGFGVTGIPEGVAAYTDRSPLVAAVSPMTDVETLDLSSSTRRQWEVAMQLAGAFQDIGYQAQAQIFSSFAKRLERDAQTKNAQPTLTAFSHSGGVFGFRAGPRLRAIDNVDRLTGKPGNELERQAFPVLVLIGMDADDLGVRFRWNGNRPEPVEPVLKFTQTNRWSPIKSSFWSVNRYDQRHFTRALNNYVEARESLKDMDALHWQKLAAEALSISAYLGQLLRRPDTETDGSRLRFALARAHQLLSNAEEASPAGTYAITRIETESDFNQRVSRPLLEPICQGLDVFAQKAQARTKIVASPEAVSVLKQRLATIGHLQFGAANSQSLPLDYIAPAEKPAAAPKPSVEEIVPGLLAQTAVETKTRMIIRGRDLKAAAKIEPAGGRGKAEIVRLDDKNGAFIVFDYTPEIAKDAPLPYTSVSFAIRDGSNNVLALTPPVELKPTPSDKPAITIERKVEHPQLFGLMTAVSKETITVKGSAVTADQVKTFLERDKKTDAVEGDKKSEGGNTSGVVNFIQNPNGTATRAGAPPAK